MLLEAEKPVETLPPEEARKRRLLAIYGSLGLTTVAFFASFHPVDLGLLAWVALVPLFSVALRENARTAVAMCYGATFLYHILGLSWIALADEAAALGWAITCFLEGFYTVAIVLAVRYARSRTRLPVTVLLPPLWVMGEHHRGAHLMAIKFPWLLLGQSQHARTTLIQIADVTSIYGLSFLVVLVNAFLVDVVLLLKERQEQGRDPDAADAKRLAKLAAYPLGLLLLANVYGLIRTSQVESSTIPGPRILAVQCNFRQAVKDAPNSREDLCDKHIQLTQIALAGVEEKKLPDAIIWSETVWLWPINTNYPDYVAYDEHVVDRLNHGRDPGPHRPGDVCRRYDHDLYEVARAYKGDLILGTICWDPLESFWTRDARVHNSIYQLGKKTDGTIGFKARYDKINLVPATEGIPGKDTWYGDWFYKLVKSFVPPGFEALDPGEKPVLMELAGDAHWKVSCDICFEVSFPELIREGVLAGADVLVCPSNDAWFWFHTSGDLASAEIPLALDHARFRAIETRRPMVRVVNRGITCFVDPLGNMTDQVEAPVDRGGGDRGTSPLNVSGSILKTVSTTKLETFYVRFGDVFAWITWIASAWLLGLSYVRGRKSASSGSSGPAPEGTEGPKST